MWHETWLSSVRESAHRKEFLVLTLIILIVLVILIIGSVPAYPYSRNWGYAPGGTLAAILVILLLLWVFGVLRF
jgi:membrane protease YdiL (CAAX protease family)